MTLANNIRRTVLGGLAAALPINAQADSFFRAVNAPGNQLDQRVSYSETELNGKQDRTLTETSIAKWWPTFIKEENWNAGPWVSAVVPYSSRDNGKAQSSGLRDVSFSAVGRLQGYLDEQKKDSFNIVLGGGVTLPTGDDRAVPALGTGRTDVYGELATTSLLGKWQINSATRYTFTEDKGGKNVPDVLYNGVAVGYQISPKWIVGVGASAEMQMGKGQSSYQLQAGPIARFTPNPKSKRVHFEAGARKVFGKETQEGFNVALWTRVNF